MPTEEHGHRLLEGHSVRRAVRIGSNQSGGDERSSKERARWCLGSVAMPDTPFEFVDPWAGSDFDQGIEVLKVDLLVRRDEDLPSFARGDDGIAGHVRPVGDFRLDVVKHQEARDPQADPMIEVAGVRIGVPPSRRLPHSAGL